MGISSPSMDDTSASSIPHKDPLEAIRGKEAHLIGACRLIEIALGIEEAQQMGEALESHLGARCDGLLSIVNQLMCGRPTQRITLEYCMYIADVFRCMQLQGVLVHGRLNGA